MMKKLRLVLPVICGIAAAAAGWLYLSALEAKYSQGYEKIPVVAAGRYIEQSSVIESGDVELRSIPREFAQPGHLKSIGELMGPDKETPGYMTTAPLLKGEQIIGTKLVRLGSETGLSAIVPSGKRAFSLICPGMGIKGIIAPGDRVDVLAVFDERVHTILQNVQVLGIARRIQTGASGIEKRSEMELKFGRDDAADEALPVTLSVKPAEAQSLALAAEKGRIYLSLRPLGERTTGFIPALELEKGAKGFAQGGSAFADFAGTAKKKYDEAAELWKKFGYK